MMRQRTLEEWLDHAQPPPALLRRNLAEMDWLFRWSGGAALAWRALFPLLEACPQVLELASGGGAGLRRLRGRARRAGRPFTALVSDVQPRILRIAASVNPHCAALVCDARHLPLPQVDVIYCAQALHHLAPGDLVATLCEWGRAARRGGVVVDLQRGWTGYLAARLAALGPLTALGRHDGPASVLRAFTAAEVHSAAMAAGLPNPQLLHTPGYWALRWKHEGLNYV